MHRLGRVKSPGLEQLVCRGSPAAPAKIPARTFAGVDTAPDIAADGFELLAALDIRKSVLGDVA